ncbi:MAG: hypothetical protein WAV05_18325 [Anaerolineales bacterium]
MTSLDRLLLLVTCLLAAYQVVVGINGLENVPTIAYTIAFGVLLVACLLIIILGFDVLNSRIVVMFSSIIPLSLSLGLIWEQVYSWRVPYLIFVILGYLAIIITRLMNISARVSTFILAIVHGVAGLVVFLLPSILSAQGIARPGFAFVGLGGALIGLAGLLLYFLKTGRPIVSRQIILRILPAIFLLMTLTFVVGFTLA